MKATRNKIPPAIVLSGHTMALGVVRSLGTTGVPVVVLYYDEGDTAPLSRYVTHSIRAPHPERDETGFIGLLTKCAEHFGDGVLFPTSDETVVAVARHKEVLQRHYKVACPEWEIVRKFIDKMYTYASAEANGVPAPWTIVPSSLEEVEEHARRIEFPCLVKPSQSHLFYDRFGRKMFPVDNREQLMLVCGQAAGEGLQVMLQEIIPGDDSHVVNYNCYFHAGQALVEFTAAHVRNAPPLWGSPRVAVSQDIPEVIDPGRRILRAIGFEGYACTEFKRDPRDSVYKLMEVNGRHNLSTLLAVHCGINFPLMQYRHLTNGQLPSESGFRKGVYWIDLTRDIAYSVRYRSQERYSPMQYLRPYLQPHVFAILSWKDPRPFIQRCRFLARRAAARFRDARGKGTLRRLATRRTLADLMKLSRTS